MKTVTLAAVLMAACLSACTPEKIEPFVPEEKQPVEKEDDGPTLPEGTFSYTGEHIGFIPQQTPSYSYDIDIIPIAGCGKYEGRSGQGFTCWGDTGFFFYDGGYCQSASLSKRTILSSFALPEPVCNKLNHAGQANFSGEYYHADDPFPLLYLSSYLESCCYVLRMTTSSAELVQTIYLTDGTKDESGNWNLSDAQAFFPDGEKLVIKMGATDPTGYKYKYWMVFDMPYSKFGEKYYLFEEKQTDRFYIRTLPDQYNGSRNYYNAGCALNGRLYVLAGFRGDTSRLLVMDYDNHRIVTDIHWEDERMTAYEQEQCSVWTENQLLVNFNGADQLACVTFR